MASGSKDRTVKLWNTKSGEELFTLTGHQHAIVWVAFSPDSQVLASASNDHSIKLWDANTGHEKATLNGHLMGVTWVAFSPDGRRLASTGWDHTLKLWDTRTGREVATIEDRKESLQCGLYASNGMQLFAAGGDNTTRLWTADPHQEITTLTGHTANVDRVTFSLDGKRVYSEAANERLVWDVATGLPEKNANWEPPAEQKHVSPDGRWFVTSEFHNVLLVDREYKTTPREKAYRTGKARLDPVWHHQQAAAATGAKNWYAATFHFGWLAKHAPDQVSIQDGLQTAFQKLESQFEQEGRDIQPCLPMVANESLKLSRGDEWSNPGFEKPKIRKTAFAFQEAIPGWRTTSDLFEIWSTGFVGVVAYDGDQFVELNANEEGTLYQERADINRDAVIQFSFAHRGRNGDDTIKLTITDLGADNSIGSGDDTELFSKEYTTGTNHWTVYDSTTEPTIKALGNKTRFAYSAVSATGGRGPDKTEGNFLDAVHFGVGVVSAKHKAFGARKLRAFLDGGKNSSHYLGMREDRVGISDESKSNGEGIVVFNIEEKDNVTVLTNREGKYLTAQGQTVLLTDNLEPGSRCLIRHPLKPDLNPNDGWFSLESAADPGRFLRHYSLSAYAHKRSELTPSTTALFPPDATWRFVDAQ